MGVASGVNKKKKQRTFRVRSHERLVDPIGSGERGWHSVAIKTLRKVPRRDRLSSTMATVDKGVSLPAGGFGRPGLVQSRAGSRRRGSSSNTGCFPPTLDPLYRAVDARTIPKPHVRVEPHNFDRLNLLFHLSTSLPCRPMQRPLSHLQAAQTNRILLINRQSIRGRLRQRLVSH
jgi:hypothetical protein